MNNTVKTSMLDLTIGVDHNATKKFVQKSIADPAYFVEKCLSNYIKPMTHQLELLTMSNNHRLMSVKAARVTGVTTTVDFLATWHFVTAYQSVVVIRTMDPMGAVRRMESCIHNMDVFETPDVIVKKVSQNVISVFNPQMNNELFFVSENVSTELRGMTINTIILDVCGKDVPEDMLNGLIQVASNTVEFHSLSQDSVFPSTVFTCRLPWHIGPLASEDFKSKIVAQIGYDEWNRQYGN